MRLSAWRRLDGWFAPPPHPQRVEWLTRHIYAHRGWHGQGRVENSPSAFAAALQSGLGIECDVQQSADGEAMVFHDWDLDRLSHERGPVRDRTAAALGEVRLAGKGEPIWTLPQLLSLLGGRVPLLVEVKSRREVPYLALCRAVARALERYSGPVAVMSFDPRVVRWFARRAPSIVRGLVLTEEADRYWHARLRRRASLWRAQPEFLAYDVRDLPSAFAASQRQRGLPLLTWTVSDTHRLSVGRQYADALIAESTGLAEALADH